MVQRQGSGFGFANIPTGGIADLVKAPTITPARVSSFSPVPTLRRRKEPRKGLKGAVLGSVSPFLGDAALSGIAKILPGLYRSEEDILARYGLSPSIPDDTPIGNIVRQQTLKDVLGTDPIYASDRAKAALGVGDLIASADPFTSERIKRSALVDKALPRKIPKEKTAAGEILSSLLSYAPGLALGDEEGEGLEEFLSAVGSTKKAQDAIEKLKTEGFLKRETARGTQIANVGDFTRGIGNGVVFRPGDTGVRTVRREFLVSPDKQTKYILSKGDEQVDFVNTALGTAQVPKGQYYIKEDFTLDPEKLPDDKIVDLLVTTEAVPKQSSGVVRFSLNEEGRPVGKLYVVDHLDGGKEKTVQEMNELYGDIWTRPGPGFGFKDRAFKPEAIQAQVEWMERRNLKATSLISQLSPLRAIASAAMLAVEEDRPEIFSNTGAAAGFIVDLQNNVDALVNVVKDSLGTDPENALRDSLRRSQQNNPGQDTLALALMASQIEFDDAIRSGDKTAINIARDKFRQTARAFKDNVAEQDSSIDLSFFDFIDDDNEFNEIAIERSKILSAQLRLAYMSAAQDGSTGVALSDKDVANYLQRTGYGSQNPAVVLDKIINLYGEALGEFDNEAITRGLFVNSRGAESENIDYMDTYVRGLGVSQKQLNDMRDKSKSEEERKKVAADVFDAMNARTGSLASTHFIYDPESGRILLRDVENILSNQVVGEFDFIRNLFGRKGLTIDNILKLKANPVQARREMSEEQQKAAADITGRSGLAF